MKSLQRIIASLVVVCALISVMAVGFYLSQPDANLRPLTAIYADAWGAVLTPQGLGLVLIVLWSAYSGGCLVRVRARSLEQNQARAWESLMESARSGISASEPSVALKNASEIFSNDILARLDSHYADLRSRITSIRQPAIDIVQIMNDLRTIALNLSEYASDADQRAIERDENLQLLLERQLEATPETEAEIAALKAQLKLTEMQRDRRDNAIEAAIELINRVRTSSATACELDRETLGNALSILRNEPGVRHTRAAANPHAAAAEPAG